MFIPFRFVGVIGFCGAMLLGLAPNNVQATLLGDTITGCVSTNSTGFTCEDSSINFFSFNAGPLAAVVGAGTEFTRVLSPGGTAERTLTADLTGDQVTIAVDGTNSTFTGGGHAANIWQFADLDWVGMAGSVSSRFSIISSPHSAQYPYSSSSTRFSAALMRCI